MFCVRVNIQHFLPRIFVRFTLWPVSTATAWASSNVHVICFKLLYSMRWNTTMGLTMGLTLANPYSPPHTASIIWHSDLIDMTYFIITTCIDLCKRLFLFLFISYFAMMLHFYGTEAPEFHQVAWRVSSEFDRKCAVHENIC